MMSLKFTPSDRRPIRKIDTTALVAEFQAKGGMVRRFEAGETASYDSLKIYLLEQGYQLSMVRNMNCVKRVGAKGKGKAMHWSKKSRSSMNCGLPKASKHSKRGEQHENVVGACINETAPCAN